MLDEQALRSMAPAIDQLSSVFNEVRDGQPHGTHQLRRKV